MLVVMSGDVPLNVQTAGGGPPIIFIHGWASSLRFWRFQFSHFARRYRVVAYDLRGHGGSGRPRGKRYSVEYHVGDLECIVEELDLGEPILVGHSLGGMIAMKYALNHPGDVRGLVLAGASPRPAFNWREKAKMTLFRWIVRLSRRLAARLTRRALFSPSTEPELVGWVRRESMRTPTHVLLACLRAAEEFDVMEKLGDLRTPTALVVAERDRAVPPSIIAYMERVMPMVRRLDLPGAGHNCMLERPQLFNQLVEGFIGELLKTC